MFKAGDKVILKYPERSTWRDTMDAIRSGTLVKGNVYQVVYADNDEVTLLFFDKKAPGRNSHWTLSPHALIPFPERKYNLPDWW